MTFTLGDLVSRLSSDLRRTLLCSCFTYPRAKATSESEAAVIDLPVHDVLNFDYVRSEIEQSVEVLAHAAREDLALFVDMMETVHDEIPFERFEAVHVRRAGVLLLRLRMLTRPAPTPRRIVPDDPSTPRSSPDSPGRETGRVATVEINEYRRHILTFMASSRLSPVIYLAFGLGIAVGLFVNPSLISKVIGL